MSYLANLATWRWLGFIGMAAGMVGVTSELYLAESAAELTPAEEVGVRPGDRPPGPHCSR